ncbi:hypothetical protein CLOM_g8747 [Closterium sp. NIES-68]|nr:hypothetical protein CLOM_g8747 [Closterium sp. NIES-68]GJP64776.1 hypothetical protein CLOP_g21723 [Closterium sp. NIES-67]
MVSFRAPLLNSAAARNKPSVFQLSVKYSAAGGGNYAPPISPYGKGKRANWAGCGPFAWEWFGGKPMLLMMLITACVAGHVAISRGRNSLWTRLASEPQMILAAQKALDAQQDAEALLSGPAMSVRVTEDLKVRDSSIDSTVATRNVVAAATAVEGNVGDSSMSSVAAKVGDALERQAEEESAVDSPLQITAKTVQAEEPLQEEDHSGKQQQAEAEKQRYYMVVGGNNTCIEEDEWKWSFLCAAAEAKALKRVLVIPLMYCFTGWGGKPVERPMALYYDVDKMKSIQPLVSDLEFDLRFGDWRSRAFRKRYTVREFGSNTPTSEVRSDAGDAHLVVRILQEQQRAARICKGEDSLVRNVRLVQERRELLVLSGAIAASMGNGDYAAVLVKRAKRSMWTGWSNVDRHTRPAALLKSLPRFIPKGRHVYIASNERTPGFFSPLASLYRIHVLSDFRHLWAPGSDWYNDYRDVLAALRMRGAEPAFDLHMKGIVDRLIMKSASMKVDVFKDIVPHAQGS